MYTVFAKSVFFSRFKFKFRPFERAKRWVQIIVFSKFKDQFSFHFEGSDSEAKTSFNGNKKFILNTVSILKEKYLNRKISLKYCSYEVNIGREKI
jgi:hypothetical protein